METKKLKKGKFSAVTIPMLLLFIVIIALTLLPFISIFLASFRPGNEIMRQGLGLNLDFSKMDLNSYRLLFTGDNQNYFTYFFNSLKLTALQTTLTLIFSAFVAYGFSMYNFRGKTLLFGLVLLMMTTPVEILMLPLFLEMTKLHLYDSLWAIILPQITAPLPIFFFRQYLVGLLPDHPAPDEAVVCGDGDLRGHEQLELVCASGGAAAGQQDAAGIPGIAAEPV